MGVGVGVTLALLAVVLLLGVVRSSGGLRE